MDIDGGLMVLELELAPVACCTPVAGPDITAEQAGALAAIFKALADRTGYGS